VCLFFIALVALAPAARADVAILLEEPYSLDGSLAGTAIPPSISPTFAPIPHATPPLQSRRIRHRSFALSPPRGLRLGRHSARRLSLRCGYAQGHPLFVDPKLAWFLRNQYRRAHFADIVPDPPTAKPDTSDWYQLIGSAFDRTLYGFQLPTSPEDDDRLIAKFNSGQNKQAYKLVTDNCADFVHDVVTFYYPDSVWRSKLGDLGVMTPKQAAKSFSQFAKRNPQLHSLAFSSTSAGHGKAQQTGSRPRRWRLPRQKIFSTTCRLSTVRRRWRGHCLLLRRTL